jgi:hypothetical protein
VHGRVSAGNAQELETPPNPLISFTGDSFKRLLGRLIFVGACFATLVAMFYAVENWRGKRAFTKYSRELQAKGEILDWKGVLPPPVPESQNLAEASVFRGLLDYERGPQGTIWRNTNNTARLERMARVVSWSVHTKSRHSENLDKNELINFSGYQEYFLLNTNAPHATSAQTPVQDILFALSPFESDLKELKNAAATHPACRFPVHYEDSIGCLLPHLGKLKMLEQYLKLHAAALLESGRKDEAFEDLQLMFRLAEAVQDEPFMISHLVRVASLALSLQVVKEGLVRHAWTAEQLVWIQNRCTEINLVRDAEKQVKGERALGVECIDMVRRKALPVDVLFGEGENSGTDRFFRTAMYFLAPAGWYSQNALSVCRFNDGYLRACINSSIPQIHSRAAEKIEDEMQRTRRTPFNMIAKLLSPSMSSYWLRTAHGQTALQHAMLGCAIERHRLKSGHNPGTLQALSPQFLEKLPADVISGEPFRYRLGDNDNYLLYGVGWNAKDDGGVAAAWTKTGVDQKRGDWVWSLTPTEAVRLP